MLVKHLVDRFVHEFCSRWLIGFRNDKDLDISLTAGTIKFSDLHFNLAELRTFAPAFSPRLLFVGSVLIDLPFLGRPLKATVSDVIMLLSADTENLKEAELRLALSAQVFVTYAMQRAAAAAAAAAASGGGQGLDVKPEALENMLNHAQNIEIHVQRVHIRVEDAGKAALGMAQQAPFALGLLVAEAALLPEQTDGRAFEEFQARLNLQPLQMNGEKKVERSGHFGEIAALAARPSPNPAAEAEISKLLAVTEAQMYFCRDQLLSRGPPTAALARMRHAFSTLPTALPPLLRPVSFGAAVHIHLSKEVLGVVNALRVSAVAGSVAVEAGDEQAEAALRWISRLQNHAMNLQVNCARPRPPGAGWNADDSRASFVRARWRHAVGAVVRELNVSRRAADDALIAKAVAEARAAAAATPEATAAAQSETSEAAKAATARRWRLLFKQWAACGRYIAIRLMLGDSISIERFKDQNGTYHYELHETLLLNDEDNSSRFDGLGRPMDLQKSSSTSGSGAARAKPAVTSATLDASRGRSRSPLPTALAKLRNGSAADTPDSSGRREPTPRGTPPAPAAPEGSRQSSESDSSGVAAKYLMPSELPEAEMERVRHMVSEGCRAGDSAILQDVVQDATTLQVLWALQLELDTMLPREMAAAARRLATERWEWWRHMAEVASDQQRKVGKLGLAESAPAIGFDSPILEAAVGNSALSAADLIGTLLVRVQQATGVTTLLSASPDAFATITVEESSVAANDLDTARTQKAKYDHKAQRCVWGETFRFAVELDEAYAKANHARRRRRPLSSTPSAPEPAPQSSFLLLVHVEDKGTFLDDDLGSCTLSGSTLTRTANRVLEHTIALFLPPTDKNDPFRRRRKGAPPVQLTLLTAFVPPGDDAAAVERELANVGNRLAAEQAAADKTAATPAAAASAAASGNASAAAASADLQEAGATMSAVVDVDDLFTPRGTGGIRTVESVALERGVPAWKVSRPRVLAFSTRLAGFSARFYVNGSRAQRAAAELAVRAKESGAAAAEGRSLNPAAAAGAAGHSESLILLLEAAVTEGEANAALDAVAGMLTASTGVSLLQVIDHRAGSARGSGKGGGGGAKQPQLLHVGPLRAYVNGRSTSRLAGASTAAAEAEPNKAASGSDGGAGDEEEKRAFETQLERFWGNCAPTAFHWDGGVGLGSYEVALAPDKVPEAVLEVWRAGVARHFIGDHFWQPIAAHHGARVNPQGKLDAVSLALQLPSKVLRFSVTTARPAEAARSSGGGEGGRKPEEPATADNGEKASNTAAGELRIAELESEVARLRQQLSALESQKGRPAAQLERQAPRQPATQSPPRPL